MSFKNKVVLVIGASSGIGEATAIAFSAEGAHVAIVGRNENKLKAVAEKCHRKPLIIKADISNDGEAANIIERTIQKFNKLDILVNNAGIFRLGTIIDGSIMKTYDEIMNINLRGLVNITCKAAPHLIKSKGNIVITSSVAGSLVPKVSGSCMYAVSKAALNQFTKAAAIEFAPHGVRVNAISPGPVHTDLINSPDLPSGFTDIAKQSTALKRVSAPGEIADAILYMTNEKSKSLTGSNLLIDNGYFWHSKILPMVF